MSVLGGVDGRQQAIVIRQRKLYQRGVLSGSQLVQLLALCVLRLIERPILALTIWPDELLSSLYHAANVFTFDYN